MIDAGSAFASFLGTGFGVSATTIGGAVRGSTGFWAVVVDVSSSVSIGGLAFDELLRIRNAVKIGPAEIVGVDLVALAKRSVDFNGEVMGRVPKDRTWATIGEQEGPART